MSKTIEFIIKNNASFFQKVTGFSVRVFESEILPLLEREVKQEKAERRRQRQRQRQQRQQQRLAKNLPAAAARRKRPTAVTKFRERLRRDFLMYLLSGVLKFQPNGAEVQLTQECLAELCGAANRSTVCRAIKRIKILIENLAAQYPEFVARLEKRNSAIHQAQRKSPSNHHHNRGSRKAFKIRTVAEFRLQFPQIAFPHKRHGATDDEQVMSAQSADAAARRRRKRTLLIAAAQRTGEPRRENDPASASFSPDDDASPAAALEYLIFRHWRNQIKCPFCGFGKATRLKCAEKRKDTVRAGLFKCAQKTCRRQFTVLTRTPLAGCRLTPVQILRAVSCLGHHRTTCCIEKLAAAAGITYKSAWRLHDIAARQLLLRRHRAINARHQKKPVIIKNPAGDGNPIKRKRKLFSAVDSDLLLECLLNEVSGTKANG